MGMPIRKGNDNGDLSEDKSDYQQERIKDFNNYEVNKYMRSDVKPISMPKM